MTPNELSGIPVEEIAAGDAGYVPFKPFAAWASASVDESRWEAHARLITERDAVPAETLLRARDVAKRAAAIETGALENLYELDRGVTITIATQSAMWEAAYEKQEEHVKALIDCQLSAYDFVLDFATREVPVAEAWIRVLHEELCRAQATYKVDTLAGPQHHELKKGHYKEQPNHVRLASGSLHSYAPVHETAVEMQRLIAEMRTDGFTRSHPVLQAAYAHHAFACIHPFQDGNGRVARALASVFLYRAANIPLLILVDHRNRYLDALREADKGNYQELVDFVISRGVDAFILINQSLSAAEIQSPGDLAGTLNRLYHTKGGYTHHQVDSTGIELLTLLERELREQIAPLVVTNQLTISAGRGNGNLLFDIPNYRGAVSLPSQVTVVSAQASAPAEAALTAHVCFRVPRDCGLYDPIILHCPEFKMSTEVPISNLVWQERAAAQLQIHMFARELLAKVLNGLTVQATAKFKEQGY
jgi:Fic family protein